MNDPRDADANRPPGTRGDLEFRRLLDKLPAAAYTCDAQGLITYFNAHAVALWGRSPRLNDPVDRFCGSFRLFSKDGTPITHDKCWMALALENGQEYNGEEILIERPDGTRRAVLAHANPFRDEAGNLSGAVNMLVDITDRKQSEDHLRDADRRKSEFLAMLAHELRNPLAPLRNGLQLIRLARNDWTAVEEARGMMERQVGHLVRLIDDLLDLSRISNGKIELRKERVDLAEVVQDAVETSRPRIQDPGHQFQISLPPAPLHVEADRVRLAQVFANLLNNSAKFTPPGGHISLSVEREGSDAIIRVKDDGVGIPADMLPHIFDMFTQVDRSLERSKGGLGIGLGLVRGLVEMHGGRVHATSGGEGKGSEFTVRLPAVSRPAPARERQDDVAPARGSSRHRILVVDDNKDSAVSLSAMLRILGHEMHVAYDGVEGVHAAGRVKPDVVLLDIGLPGMNGYDACREIRKLPGGGDMVLIALTGWGQDEDKSRSLEAGFDSHMVKPVDPAVLGRVLEELLLVRP